MTNSRRPWRSDDIEEKDHERILRMNAALAVKMANVTEQIKGFGHVKEKHLAAVMVQWQNCMDVFRKAI